MINEMNKSHENLWLSRGECQAPHTGTHSSSCLPFSTSCHYFLIKVAPSA